MEEESHSEDLSQRPKRRRVDRTGRSEALEKFRNLKGKKNKYDVDQLENVYDEVNEDEYQQIVSKKASENWLEEDDEGDYIEDGREIFDEEAVSEAGKSKAGRPKKAKMDESESKSIPKISKFFGREQQPSKKEKKDDVDDKLLDKILDELSEPKAGATSKTEPDGASVAPKIATKTEKSAPEVKATASPEKVKTFLQGWKEASGEGMVQVAVDLDDEIIQEMAQIEVGKNEQLNMWLWDICESGVKGDTSQLYLFGKVEKNGSFSSICVHITQVENIVYLLPRKKDLKTNEEVSIKDVYDEFSVIAKNHGITEHRSKAVTKNFAFEVPNVSSTRQSECLMVYYNGKGKAPLTPSKAYSKIEYIFGTNVSATETFLLNNKIKGPCWITIDNYALDVGTWCKYQVKCEKMSSISVCAARSSVAPPPLSIMSINLRVGVDAQNKSEIVAVSCLTNSKFQIDKPAPKKNVCDDHFCIISHPSNKPFPFDFKAKSGSYRDTKLIKCENELALLNCFLSKIQALDPDVIVTQDAYARQLDVLCSRITMRKIPMWSKLGKLRKGKDKFPVTKKVEEYFIGRMICDVKSSVEELKSKLRSYDMQSLCTEILKIPPNQRRDIFIDEIPTFYETSESLLDLVSLTMQDNLYSLRIMYELNCLPLALQITNIAGNLMSHTLRGGRAERNEFLLLHAFSEANFIVPEKQPPQSRKETGAKTQDAEPAKKKAQYVGGLVLEPIKGFYDRFILLMDFNSLYPSIIQEYNICYTTVDANSTLPDSSVDTGILPRQIKKLVESRRQVKGLMKQHDLSEDLKMQYDIRQMALKLTANSMYGCLGFSQSRFFAPHLAALVTQKGREILMNTKSIVEKQQYQVVYGDTDSIMVLTNSVDYDQVQGIGVTLKQLINKIYKHVELDIDGIFKYLLLLKKKKYAAMTISRQPNGTLVETKEIKGLDIVRRDWCKLAQSTGERVLDEILSDKSNDDRVCNIHAILEEVKRKFDEDKIDLVSLEITKQLTRAIVDYSNSASLPHVMVASRMNSTMNRNFKKGDIVGYVICKDGTDESHIKRAYHLDELKCNPKLEIDKEYYLANQLHPVISRIIEPIDGTDATRIAQSLGLDASKYRSTVSMHGSNNDENEESMIQNNLKRFRFCRKFFFPCIECGTVNGVIKSGSDSSLKQCANKECVAKPFKFVSLLTNQLVDNIRIDVKRFYENWMVCDDPVCSHNTKSFIHVTEGGKPLCPQCGKGCLVRQYSEKDLFNQLCYYQYIFTPDSSDGPNSETRHVKTELLKIVDEHLKGSGYFLIKMSLMYSQQSRGKSFSGADWLNSLA